jgi:protein ImuB
MPCDGQPLSLLQGPERLDTGWWDDARVDRDYYIALHPEGGLWWVFRPAEAPAQWFVHGFFT